MKRTLLSLVCMVSIVIGHAQAVKTGNVIIDGYYGFPNLTSVIIKRAIYNANAGDDPFDFKLTSLGPLGIRVEYLLNDKIGVGIESNYTNTSAFWKRRYNNSGMMQTYTYEVSFERFRIMPRFNFHFVKSGDKLDGYCAVATGYADRKLETKSDDPDYKFASFQNLIPIAFKTAVGLRYFFTENIGANMEFGLGGGPLLAIGLSAKFGGSTQ